MTTGLPSLVCEGCGHCVVWERGSAGPFGCPAARAGDDIDHVLRPDVDPAEWLDVDRDDPHPFICYRRRLFSYQLARARGTSDQAFCELVRDLDAAVARVDGHGLTVTPLARQPRLATALDLECRGLWVKDETVNVAGSHKGRHLFGVMLCLLVWEQQGGTAAPATSAAGRRLAIASCGNAALAAAVVARAAGRDLDVFIPPSADPFVVSRLDGLGARVIVCERRPGEAGDPCYLRFREALSAGAIPFCCQGPDNGLTIEGGKTLAYEVIDALGRDELARVFLQVGGGAFASAFSQACREARRATALPRLPRIHPVQTRGAFPLRRAYDALVDTLVQRATPPGPRPAARTADVAEWMRRHVSDAVLQRALDGAARRRHAFMRPWETEPRSIARGILDDETYDWLEIVKGTIEGGGWPLVVTEDELARANELARAATGSDVDHTGSAGLAGIVHVIATDPATLRALRDEHVVVVFTGARRGA